MGAVSEGWGDAAGDIDDAEGVGRSGPWEVNMLYVTMLSGAATTQP